MGESRQERRYGGDQPDGGEKGGNKCEERGGEGKVEADERKGSDRFRRGGGEGGEQRGKREGEIEAGNSAGVPSTTASLAAGSQPGGRTTQLLPRRPES